MMNRMKNRMMTKFLKYGIAAVLGMLVLPLMAQNADKALTFEPELLVVGEPVAISYNNNKTNLANEKEIKAVVYYWEDYSWIAQDLPITHKNGVWNGKFNVPENAALVALKFYDGNNSDTGGTNTYVQFTVDENKKNLPSAYIGWGLLRTKGFEKYAIPAYVSGSDKIDDSVFLYWCNQEITHFPDNRKNVFYFAAKAIGRIGDTKSDKLGLIENDIQGIIKQEALGKATEKDLIRSIDVASTVLKNDSLATQIKKLALEKYPNGILARDAEIWRIFRISDADRKEKEFEAFIKRFPPEEFADVETETSLLYLGKTYQSIVYNQIVTHNNYDLAYKYIHYIPYSMLGTFFWHMVQMPYDHEQMTAEQLLPFAQLLMNEMLSRPRGKASLVYSPLEWGKKFLAERKDALLAYAKILNETGATTEAFEWLQKIEPYFENKSSNFTSFYIEMLDKTGNESEIIPAIEAGVKQNAASPEMLDRLKEHYIQEHGSASGFDAYVNSLKSGTKVAKQQEEIEKSLVNKPIKLFALEKLTGGTVDMRKLKGKVIVLDFWATWCAPCKASMPGMQMAVNRFENDDDVEFFFVATQETRPNYKNVISDFIEKKNYSFNVLLDAVNPERKTKDYVYSVYTKTFHFSGIPTKMVIDKKGRLRWYSVGYKGNASELADEISYVVELLREEE